MESWQRQCSPEDLIELAYLGLSQLFGRRASPTQLLDCAREASSRMTTYQTQWFAGEACSDVRLSESQTIRLQRILAQQRGLVVATFQIGPFLQLPFLLSEIGLPVMLLMDPENFEVRMDSCAIEGIGEGGTPYGYWPKGQRSVRAGSPRAPVRFVTSDDPAVAWKMTRWLRSGNVVFAYMDGNRGVEGELNTKNSVIVPFFGADIWVRKGLAYVAGFAGAPITFMICRQEQSGHVIRLSPALTKRKEETQEAFCQRCNRKGFRLLETHIVEDVACWNEWHQLHRWLVRRTGPTEPLKHISAELALQRSLKVEPQTTQVRLGEQEVLVNQRTGAAIVLTPVIAEVLRLAQSGSTVEAILNGLSKDYDEQSLLEILNSLAQDAFLQVSAS